MDEGTHVVWEQGERRLELVRGDITEQDVDVVVNAANSGLRGGGGVDGAIHRAGGPSILEECREIGGCPTGDAVVTRAGDLAAGHVIHAVGPRYRDGAQGEGELLRDAYRASMTRADEVNAGSVAFPSLSTGAYRYPVQEAARIALATVRDALASAESVRVVRFVLFDEPTLAAYREAGRDL